MVIIWNDHSNGYCKSWYLSQSAYFTTSHMLQLCIN